MAKHRTKSIAFKRQVVQGYLAGETPHGLARRHHRAVNRQPIPYCASALSLAASLRVTSNHLMGTTRLLPDVTRPNRPSIY